MGSKKDIVNNNIKKIKEQIDSLPKEERMFRFTGVQRFFGEN